MVLGEPLRKESGRQDVVESLPLQKKDGRGSDFEQSGGYEHSRQGNSTSEMGSEA